MVEQKNKSNYSSHLIYVKGDRIHYLEQGTGEPLLFLHGMPTSSFLWRKIIPVLANHARCIAPDLIGMGLSDKPDIDYRVFDHIDYIESFIESLGLKDITLVMHGWGSVIGFDYAKRHPGNIKGLVFLNRIFERPLIGICSLYQYSNYLLC